MGMGNDGIEVSNSLDTCTQVNNSGIRDANPPKSIDVMKKGNGNNLMGNITSTDGIDSTFSGATECSSGSRTDPSDINNAPLSSTEEQNDENYSQPPADELTNETSGERTEKNEDNNSLSQKNTTLSGSLDAYDDNKTVIIVEEEDPANAKPRININTEVSTPTETTPAPVYRNECLLRVSYLKRDWGGKRVSDIRSVSDLLESFYSLEEPIIMPLPRQHDYYDQWARIPRGDVIQRLYPRTGCSSVSTKGWALFQTIQNDQSKSNSTSPLASSPQRLAPPSNGQVMCDSLESIIEHYNQFLSARPVEAIPNSSGKTTAQQRVTASQIRTNSGSSRSNSCGNNRGNLGVSQRHDGTALKASGLKSKASSASCDVKIKNIANVTDLIPSSNETESAQSFSHRAKRNLFPDYELCSDTASDSVLSNVEMLDNSTANQVNKMSSSSTSKSHIVRRIDASSNCEGQNEVLSARSIQCRIDPLASLSAREKRATINKLQPEFTYSEMPSPPREQGGSAKDGDGNVAGINTNMLSLSLPYERSHTVPEIQAPSTKNGRPKSKPSSPHEDVNCDKVKLTETHERFPLRSTAFISRGKRAHTTIDFSQNRTRLKNLTRSIPARSHNIHDLKDSLLINEIINCDTDKHNDQQKWDHLLKRRTCPSQRAKPSKHECRPPFQLPVRMHSMLEHHLNPTMSTEGHLSPEEQEAPSRGNSAVSLASVHFLDLADLKNLLKRSNTTIRHL